MTDSTMWATIAGLVVLGALGVILLLRSRDRYRRVEISRLEKIVASEVEGSPAEVTLRVRSDLREPTVGIFARHGYDFHGVDTHAIGGLVALTFRKRG